MATLRLRGVDTTTGQQTTPAPGDGFFGGGYFSVGSTVAQTTTNGQLRVGLSTGYVQLSNVAGSASTCFIYSADADARCTVQCANVTDGSASFIFNTPSNAGGVNMYAPSHTVDAWYRGPNILHIVNGVGDTVISGNAFAAPNSRIRFGSNGIERWVIEDQNAANPGGFHPASNNSLDIGTSTLRPRSLYLGTAYNAGSFNGTFAGVGDFATGDGTYQMDFDASEGILRVGPSTDVGHNDLGCIIELGNFVGNNRPGSTITVNGASVFIDGRPNDVAGTVGTQVVIRGGNHTQAANSNASSTGGQVALQSGSTNSSTASTGNVRIITGAPGNGGPAGEIFFEIGNVEVWTIDTNGHLVAGDGNGLADNTYDIGENGDNRPRTVYLGTSLIGASEAGTFVVQGADATTAATAGANLTVSAGDGNTSGAGGILDLIAGTSASGTPGVVTVNSLPLPTTLSSVASIDVTATGDTTLYTVPTGRSAIVTAIVIRPTTATAPNADATVSVGTNAATYDDIVAPQPLVGLNAITEAFILSPIGGLVHIAVAAEDIVFQIDSADTGTALTVTVDLIGYLL